MEEMEIRFMEYDHDGKHHNGVVCATNNVAVNNEDSGSIHTKQEVASEPCLICSETTKDTWYRGFQLLSGSEGCELLNEQIWSIFILRKLLDFPRQKCTTLMEETFGVSNPQSWFTLCTSCTDTVKSAMKVYLQILKLERDLTGFQLALKNTMKETLKPDMDNQTERRRDSKLYSENIVDIRTRIRSHFSEEAEKESIVPKQEREEEDIFQESCTPFEHINPTRLNEDFCEDDEIGRNYLYGQQHSDPEDHNIRPKRSRMENVPTHFYGTEEEETEESISSEGELSAAQKFANISVDEDLPTKRKRDEGHKKGKTIGSARKRLALDFKNRRKFCCKICGLKYTYLRSYKCHMIKHNQRLKQRQRLPQSHKKEIGATEPLDAALTSTIKRIATANEKHSEEADDENADQISEDYDSSSSYVPSEGESDPLEPNDGIPQKKKEYKCKRCNFCTKIWSKYKAHVVAHRSKKTKIQIDKMGKFVCEICGRRFQPRSSLVKHMARHRHNKELECPNCHYPCETPSALKKHIRYNHCERSNENYEQAKSERLQKMRLLAEQQKSVHDCELCKRRFGTFGSFKKHMWDHKNFKETTCPKCNFPCLSKSALESHLKYKRCFISPATKTTYNCDHCSYGTIQRRYFEIHCCKNNKTYNVSLSSNISETDTREIDRKDVSQEDKDAKSVEEQMKDDNATGNKYQADSKHDCKICGRNFRTKDSFRTHMTKHNKNKEFECPKCRYPYHTAESLGRHLERCEKSDQDNEHELNGDIEEQQGSVHDCEICGRNFRSKDSFRCHMSTHKNKKEFECPKCRYPHRTEESLDKHLERSECGRSDQDNEHELNGGIEEQQGSVQHCKICGRGFRTKDSFRSHMRKHKTKEFECPKCRYPYRTEESLDRHLERNQCGRSDKHNELELNEDIEEQQWSIQDCEICKRTFGTITAMKNHMWEHENCKDSTCPKCNYPCLSKSALESHLKLESCFKPPTASSRKITYKCDDCPYSTTNRSLFHNHVRRHKIYFGSQTSDGRWKCVQCNEIFHAQRPLAVHKREVHGSEIDMPTFRCSLCPKSYSKKSALINHIKEIHQKDFRFFCEVCGYGVNRKSQLEIHRRKHIDDKQCICELCGMRYRYPHSLNQHMKKDHPGGRQTAGKEFNCKYCPDNVMTFPNRALLNDHLKNRHQDLYIHKCDQCDNSYMSLGSLQLHKKNFHISNRVECQFCQKEFLSPFYLYNHYGKGGCKKKPPDFKFSIPRKKLSK